MSPWVLQQVHFCSQKHGIVLNSEPVTNGETSDTLNNVGHQVPSKLTKEELNALKTAGDGTLGKCPPSFGSFHLPLLIDSPSMHCQNWHNHHWSINTHTACHVSCHFLGTPLSHGVTTHVCCLACLSVQCSPPMAEEYVSLASQSHQVKPWMQGVSSWECRDSSDATRWFSSATCQDGFLTCSVTDFSTDQSSRGCKVR